MPWTSGGLVVCFSTQFSNPTLMMATEAGEPSELPIHMMAEARSDCQAWRERHEEVAEDHDDLADGGQHGDGDVHGGDEPGVDGVLLEAAQNALHRDDCSVGERERGRLRKD